jgi:hypothetical protein
MELNSEIVEKIFKDCLFSPEEDCTKAVEVQGISEIFLFHSDRLENYQQMIWELLDQLPHTFKEKGGGGWTFLKACLNKDGILWGQQNHADQLLSLGIALKFVALLTPKELWPLMPGGVPYYRIFEKKDVTKSI